jgi:hypothetical protein
MRGVICFCDVVLVRYLLSCGLFFRSVSQGFRYFVSRRSLYVSDF